MLALAQSAEERLQQLDNQVQHRFAAGNAAIQDIFKNVAEFCSKIMANQQASHGQQAELQTFLQAMIQKFQELYHVLAQNRSQLAGMQEWNKAAQ